MTKYVYVHRARVSINSVEPNNKYDCGLFRSPDEFVQPLFVRYQRVLFKCLTQFASDWCKK